MIFGSTPSQTVGPFFAIGLPFEASPSAISPDAPGAIRIVGAVYDGAGKPVPDSLIETWQADSKGRFADMYGYGGPSQLPGFRGFARVVSDETDATFEIITVKPGRVAGPGGLQAPHIDLSVFARGMLHRCVTRIYFEDEAEANAEDPVLQSICADRRQTLLARVEDDAYRFDIAFQGARETVFFDV